MNIEQIKQAAAEYRNDVLCDAALEVNYEEDNYDTGYRDCIVEGIPKAFAEGAEWRINSVWHNPGEKLEDGDYLTILRKGERTILEIAPFRNGKYQGTHHMEVYLGWIKVVRCASIGDLLP